MNATTMLGPPAPRTAVLVQGMLSSGTSILSCGIALLARTGMTEPNSPVDDPFPHSSQNSAVAGLNRRILQELGSGWGKPGLLYVQGKGVADSGPLIRGMIRDRYLHLAKNVLVSGTVDCEFLVLEDPSFCLLHDLWDTALTDLGYATRTVHVVSHPLEVAASLKAGQGFAHNRTLQLWVQYNLAALHTRSGEPLPVVVSSRDVMHPTPDFVRSLRADLAIPTAALSDDAVTAEWMALIDTSLLKPAIADQAVQRSPVIPSLVKRLHALLMDWNASGDDVRRTELTSLVSLFEDQSLFAGTAVMVKLPEQQQPAQPVVTRSAGASRKLLLHYHLFKNAGTSVDAILRRNFGDRWMNTEFPPPGQLDHQAAIRTLILDNPRLSAISSHTLMLPPPRIEGIEILPIVFIRHPLDRLKSAYEFERRQDGMTAAARMARDMDFAGYLRTRLAIRGDRSCRNFHVYRLAMAAPMQEGSELDRALAAVEHLPFVGLVEAFTASATLLQERARPMFPGFESFEAWENSTKARHRTLEDRLDDIRKELDDACYAEVTEANQADTVLYKKVVGLYAGGSGAV